MPQVLLVCNEPPVAGQVQAILKREGHSVETVGTKAEAFARLTSEVPCLLIHNVPAGTKDEELLRAVRQNPLLANLPVLLITAKAEWGPVFETYPKGLDMYLTRPFHSAELISQVKRLLPAKAGSD